ncbi:MAG: C45 family peptidase [Acidipropionibacterium acidipropionici]|jgi:hypothetical protein|uniref:Cysteine protease n=2 Tax=Acidipropionibacterium acidipropionici TaxID=1748 RepID=A0A142KGR7_9ACTN|nr:C45 family peptidase [Acidipropionibacterium acidipropionici]AFV90630.1 Cysteine peptidase/transferase, family C45 [Acidipropionibacterium acidipropionici ATCC 4875]ALN15184.1 cysteine protease [Acidipropionibacterium acidipropionici]AMS05305.1 cysteine protease [Acidipropionibacterium acidipropionici]AOZ46784.1 cysteine protease [Acidipropionibacterium acidipropionici]APZ09065.1 cysteine protease [Acidipropionibacterium acidipropionici]
MTAQVEYREPVSGMEWTVLSGDRREVMTALGAEHAEQIAAWRARDSWKGLVERATGARGRQFDAVVASTRRLLPVESAELGWLAEGAGVPEAELWALNLRGDLGRDGIGCSDLCTAGGSGVLMGHNEDGDGELAGLVRLVTLRIDGDPSMTVVWYPGMLPANSFVTTSAGLTFGMDHVPVHRIDQNAAGRHLVARHAQRRPDGARARVALQEIGCAGGFAFDVADGPGGRGDIIENAAGRVSVAGAADRLLRHTNHLRFIDRRPGDEVDDVVVDDRWTSESRTRFAALEAASPRLGSPEDLLAALRADGVLNREPDLYTFTSAVVDTANDRILLQGSGKPWRGVLSGFASGERMSV